MIKNPIRNIMVPIALGTLMVIPGCKEDEPAPPTKTDLLVGDWKVTEFDGNDYTQYTDYSLLFKFQRSGDWQFCYEYTSTPADNNCTDGNWQWNDAETTILIDYVNGTTTENWELDVTVLDDTKLEGNITTYTGSTPSLVKFIKVK